jgi:hypothetical protein
MADQVDEQVEDLWLERERVAVAKELAAIGIERIFLEQVAHVAFQAGRKRGVTIARRHLRKTTKS